mgnify:CR=1 FL=1
MAEDKKFYFHGMEFDVPIGVENYASIAKFNRKLVQEASDQFEEKYASYKDMDTAIVNMEQDLRGLFFKALNSHVNRLIEHGVYEISAETFLNQYYKSADGIGVACDYIEDQYSKITMDQRQQEEWRRYKSATRGRWQGGGFGVRGALTGAAMAGTANMISGAGHGIANFIGDIGSSIAASGKKRNLYENPITLRTLDAALCANIECLLFSYIACARDNTNMEYTVSTNEDIQASKNIVKNISNRDLEESVFQEAILKAYSLDPHNPHIYESLIERYSDENNELNPLLESLCLTDEIKCYKIARLYVVCSEQENIKTVDEADELLEKVHELARKMGTDFDVPIMRKLEQKRADLYKEACTFDDVVYSTPEEAKAAENEKEWLDEIIKDLDPTDEKSMKQIKHELEDKPGHGIDRTPYIDKVTKCLDEYDREQRTVGGVEYKTREEAKAAKSEKKRFDEIIKDLDPTNEVGMKQIKHELENEPGHVVDRKPYIDKVNKCLDEYDREQRTVGGVEYKTREEASESRREWDEANAILKEAANSDRKFIESCIEMIKGRGYRYIDPDQYISQLQGMLASRKQDEVWTTVEDLLDNGKYDAAIRFINKESSSANQKKSIMQQANDKLRDKLREEIKDASEYSSIGTLCLGVVGLLIVGYLVSFLFDPAFKISIALSAVGFIAGIVPTQENRRKKRNHDLIERLKKMGYSL